MCGICLFRDPSLPDITILCCGSIYHLGCLLKWFQAQSKHQAHGSCPNCRQRIKLNTFADGQSTPTLSTTFQSIFDVPQNPSRWSFGLGSESSNTSDSDEDDDFSTESSDSSDSTESFWSGGDGNQHDDEDAHPSPPEFLQEVADDIYSDYRMGLNISPHDQIVIAANPGLLLYAPTSEVPTRGDTSTSFMPFPPSSILCSTCQRVTTNDACSNRCCPACCPTQPLFCPYHYQASIAGQLRGASQDSWSDSRVSSDSESREDEQSDDEQDSVASQSDFLLPMDFRFS